MQLSSERITTAAPTQPLETITLDVGGMKCAGCVKAVEQQLTQQPGVMSACVNLVTEVATVTCQPGSVDPAALAQRVTSAGFPTQPRYAQGEEIPDGAMPGLPNPAERHRQETQRQIRQLAIAGILLVLSGIGHLGQWGWLHLPGLDNIWFHWGLATIALMGPGRSILVDGWRGLRHNVPNMNTLVGLGTLSAYTTSLIALLFPQLGWECFFDEPVMLIGFILLGRTLEQQARNRATAAFQSLLALQPRTARLVANPDQSDEVTAASYVEIPAEHVRVGEWLQVLPGEKIPVDGTIVAGQTTIDESMLTGESVPVVKQSGDFVAAGTLNQSGAIALQATRTGKDTTLAHIIALVEAAQTRKAPIQHLADTVAGYFTYGVMAIATATFLFWYLLGTHLWPNVLMSSAEMATHLHSLPSLLTPHSSLLTPHASPLLLSLKLAIAVLVVACPCALGLATPTAILVGTGIGAERGLLIRGGDVLERVHQLDTVVFDKTGTLTTGQPTVTDCWLTPESKTVASLMPDSLPFTPDTWLQIAATVESGARHPLAIAIQQQAQQKELPLLAAENFQTRPGLGVSAVVSGQLVTLGTSAWLEAQGVEIPLVAQIYAQNLIAEGKTIIYGAIAGTFLGVIAVTDILRPDAKATVECLRNMGLRVMLLTGDQQTAAEAIATALGLSTSEILANVKPDGKVAAIESLQRQGHGVAMIGDGINDAPALAQADVGISLQAGTDVAIETSQIVLMRDRLIDVVESIRLSRATFNKIRQNLFWAFAYNILGLPIAAGLLLPSLGIALSPAAAGAMMAFSSVSVVTNSLLLRRTFST